LVCDKRNEGKKKESRKSNGEMMDNIGYTAKGDDEK